MNRDSVSARTLNAPVNVPLGVTAATCAEACQSLGFSFAGVETGRECCRSKIFICSSNTEIPFYTGCDNVIRATTQRVSDNDCREICDADVTQFCGNGNRIAIYHFANATGGPTQCISTNLNQQLFKLQAEFKNPPVGGPSTVALKPVVVEMAKNVIWTILSVSASPFLNRY